MKRYRFLLLVVLAWLSACTLVPYWEGGTGPNLSPSAAPVPTEWKEYTVVGTVNIRVQPDTSSSVIGWLLAGAVVRADCDREDGFCEVPGGYVVKGCLGIGDGGCREK